MGIKITPTLESKVPEWYNINGFSFWHYFIVAVERPLLVAGGVPFFSYYGIFFYFAKKCGIMYLLPPLDR